MQRHLVMHCANAWRRLEVYEPSRKSQLGSISIMRIDGRPQLWWGISMVAALTSQRESNITLAFLVSCTHMEMAAMNCTTRRSTGSSRTDCQQGSSLKRLKLQATLSRSSLELP